MIFLCAVSNISQIKPFAINFLTEQAGLGVTTGAPYSKSHIRRSKRKAKGELSTDLTSVEEAIAAVEAQDGPANNSYTLAQSPTTTNTSKSTPNNLTPNFRRRQPGQIGEGKQVSLTIRQRRRAL